jgi:hypothetical protein
MTAAEVRAAVRAYHRIQDVLDADVAGHLETFLKWVEGACQAVTETSPTSRWARDMVGPVLAAGMGAAVFAREVRSPMGMLRIFGVIGNYPLTSQAAWRLMAPYCWEPVLSVRSLDQIRVKSGLRFNKLPADPGPVDVLEELTRFHSGEFSRQMAKWLAEYFQRHAGVADDTLYADKYRSTIANLSVMNDRGEMAQFTSLIHGPFTREEWGELIRGRLPQSRLELRAGYIVTKKFLVEYWERWNRQKDPTVLSVGPTTCRDSG